MSPSIFAHGKRCAFGANLERHLHPTRTFFGGGAYKEYSATSEKRPIGAHLPFHIRIPSRFESVTGSQMHTAIAIAARLIREANVGHPLAAISDWECFWM